MSHFPHGAMAAIHAAQEQERIKKQQQEEEMTTYSKDDLDNWEFKIVRSGSRMFHKPEAFQQLLNEEALGGWEMLEKLDDQRVRFRRPKTARRRDSSLPQGYDPYRTQVGANPQAALVLTLVGLVTMLGFGILAFALASGGGTSDDGAAYVIIAPLILILIGIAAVVAVKRQRA